MSIQKAPVKAETDFAYINKFSGRKVQFKTKPDEIMVTFQPEADDSAASTVMEATSLSVSQGPGTGERYAVYQVGPQSDLESATGSLSAHQNVANTMPVLLDDEGLTRYFLPDELTVQFGVDVAKKKAEKILKDRGCQIVTEQRTPGYYTITVPEGESLFQALGSLSALDEVQFAEPSEVGFNDELLYLPDDPSFPRLWGLHNTGQAVNNTAGIADADIDATEAWDIARGAKNVIVTVIDTGADLDHPDLGPNLLPRGGEDWDFADLGDPSPDDTHGHGTHVAGTAAAVDNATGIIGVAPGCRIMPLRVNLTSGMNQNRADAIQYVAQQAVLHPERRYVINCSWRMSGDHAGVHNAIIQAVTNGVVVVFAAGNANRDIDVVPQYPAVYPEVIAVAATDQRDRRANFSNFGQKVDVSAPGVNIFSTIPNDSYGFNQGTSMAAPHVAGLAGLIWSRNPNLSNAEVRSLVESTADDIDVLNPGFAGRLGTGRINAFKALSATPAPPVSAKVVRHFPFPQANNGSSTGLAFARKFISRKHRRPALLFLTQKPFSESIFFLNPATGAVLDSVDPQNNDTIGSLTWDGRAIRVANVTNGAGFINRIDPVTGAQIASMPVPPGRGEGLTSRRRRFYYSTINRIHVIARGSGAVLNSFPPPGGACRALTHGRGYLFSGNSSTGVITVFHRNTLAVLGTINAPGSGPRSVEGLAFNRRTRELFVANQSENRIYVLKVSF